MSEIVKYSNEINKMQFTNFSANDLNLLMKICVILKKKGNQKIELSFDELKESIGYSGHQKQFIKMLDAMTDKTGIIKIWTKDGFDKIFLFDRCQAVTSRKVLEIELNEKYISFFFELQKQFTSFSLEDFVSLESKHAKNLFRLLMQWKTKGHCPTEYEENFFTIEEIKGFLNISEKYIPKHITDEILKPAVKEINEKKLLKNLELVVHKAKKRGAPVVGYSFKFEPIEVKQITEKQKKAIEHKEAGDYKPTEELKKEPKKKKQTNQFNNFPQREYSEEDMNALERRLLHKK